MKVYDINKINILENYDLDVGYLIPDKITIIEPEVLEVKEQGHYETLAEFSNGGKEVSWVVDVKGVEYKPQTTKEENIYVYIPYTEEQLKEKEINDLRNQREEECFPIINRGILWYNNLTESQRLELDVWYNAWLDVTETLVVPEKPTWIK